MTPEPVTEEPAKGTERSAVRDQVRWAFARPWNLEKFALAVQRLTGLGLLLYLFFHVIVTSFIAGGRSPWDSIMAALTSPLTHFGELLVFVAAVFHGLNGIRIGLLELTKLVGKPARPDYPYKVQSQGRGQKSILYTSLVMSALAALGAFLIFWG